MYVVSNRKKYSTKIIKKFLSIQDREIQIFVHDILENNDLKLNKMSHLWEYSTNFGLLNLH